MGRVVRDKGVARLRETSAPVPAETTDSQDLDSAAAAVGAWCGELLLHPGENASEALAAGTARRTALDAGLAEIAAGASAPSPEFRRRFGLLLGLERIL